MQPSTAPPPRNWRRSATLARSVDIVAIALGFVLGIYGFDHPESYWLQTTLGLQ